MVLDCDPPRNDVRCERQFLLALSVSTIDADLNHTRVALMLKDHVRATEAGIGTRIAQQEM